MTQKTFVYWVNDVRHEVPINSVSLPAGFAFRPGGIPLCVRKEESASAEPDERELLSTSLSPKQGE